MISFLFDSQYKNESSFLCDGCGSYLKDKFHPIYCQHHIKCEFCGITETIKGSIHSYRCPKWYFEYNQRRISLCEKMMCEGKFSLEKFRMANITFFDSLVVKRSIHGAKVVSKERCNICYEESSDLKIKCEHYFHKGCLEEWLRISSKCPICRKNFIR